jgi:hypothetical protein
MRPPPTPAMRNVRILVCAALLAALGVVWGAGSAAAPASASGAAVSVCRERGWCTVTAAGYVTPTASQLAIGNVRGGTSLGVTQVSVGQRQVGGQVLAGSLDWSAPAGSASAACADPVLDTAAFVADNGHAIWSGCFPRCFGGVPAKFDPRCGTHGRTFCYSHDCEEYANFFPWSPRAHPVDPIRLTGHHVLDIRYLARYPDYLNGHPYYMARDVDVFHGTGNWVFVSARGCGIVVGHTGAYHDVPRHQ